MKVIGKTIYNTATEKKSGQITQNMKENIMRAKSMEKDSISGQMDRCMMETGLKIGLRAMVLTLG